MNRVKSVGSEKLWGEARRVHMEALKVSGGGCLLPDDYSDFSYESLMRWLFDEVKTWNEAERVSMGVSYKGYLEDYGWHWWESLRTGGVLVCEKSRRLVISWVTSGMELWDSVS